MNNHFYNINVNEKNIRGGVIKFRYIKQLKSKKYQSGKVIQLIRQIIFKKIKFIKNELFFKLFFNKNRQEQIILYRFIKLWKQKVKVKLKLIPLRNLKSNKKITLLKILNDLIISKQNQIKKNSLFRRNILFYIWLKRTKLNMNKLNSINSLIKTIYLHLLTSKRFFLKTFYKEDYLKLNNNNRLRIINFHKIEGLFLNHLIKINLKDLLGDLLNRKLEKKLKLVFINYLKFKRIYFIRSLSRIISFLKIYKIIEEIKINYKIERFYLINKNLFYSWKSYSKIKNYIKKKLSLIYKNNNLSFINISNNIES